MREWLARYKFRGDERMAALFARMLHGSYHRLAEEMQLRGQFPHAIGFVPLSGERLTERGFNQAEQMANGLGDLSGLPVIPLLKRVRHTDKQSKKSRQERIEGLNDMFVLYDEGVMRLERITGCPLRKTQDRAFIGPLPGNPGRPAYTEQQPCTGYPSPQCRNDRPVNILLVDDVYTTGSTLNQCAKTLVAHLHVRVYGLTWARS